MTNISKSVIVWNASTDLEDVVYSKNKKAFKEYHIEDCNMYYRNRFIHRCITIFETCTAQYAIHNTTTGQRYFKIFERFKFETRGTHMSINYRLFIFIPVILTVSLSSFLWFFLTAPTTVIRIEITFNLNEADAFVAPRVFQYWFTVRITKQVIQCREYMTYYDYG